MSSPLTMAVLYKTRSPARLSRRLIVVPLISPPSVVSYISLIERINVPDDALGEDVMLVNGTIASLVNLKIGAVVRSAPKEENKPHRSCCRYANELNRRSIASRRQFCSRAHPLPRPTLFDFLFPLIQASIRPSRWR